MINSFHGLYDSVSSISATYMCVSLSTIMSAHLVSIILGIPSGPGALYGFSFLSCALTCSGVILPARLHSLGYFASVSALSTGGFVLGIQAVDGDVIR